MTFTISCHSSAAAFLARAAPWLMDHEAEHNLVLGIAHRLAARGSLPGDVLLATVEDTDRVVGCAFRTPPWKLGLTRMPGEAIAPLADAVAARYDALPAVLGPEPVAQRFAESWRARTGVAASPGMRQRIFQARAVREPAPQPPGAMRAATNAEQGLVLEWVEAFAADAGVPFHEEAVRERFPDGAYHLWEYDGPRALAAWSARTPHGVRIGPVYTPPAWRRHGYGTALTAALTRKMLEAGNRFCFLYTDLGNPTSNAIYQRIGYEPVTDVIDFNFSSPDAWTPVDLDRPVRRDRPDHPGRRSRGGPAGAPAGSRAARDRAPR